MFGPVRLFWLRWVLLFGATVFTLFAHTVIESPATQFHMWAHNASAHLEGVQNTLDVQSPTLGILSVTIGMALNITALVAVLSMARRGFKRISSARE